MGKSTRRNRRRKEEQRKEIRTYLRNEFEPLLEEAARAPETLERIPSTIFTSGETGVPERYIELLEADAVGRMIRDLMDWDEPRGTILSLTSGSVLGEVLQELFEHIDEDLGRDYYTRLYRQSLNAVSYALQAKIFELEREAEKETTVFDPASDDLPF